MKTIFNTLFILFFLFISCKDDENLESTNENISYYDTSVEKWDELKNSNGNSYKYEITSNSVFGFGVTTKIEVEKGTVITRSYEEFEINYETGERTITYSYEENSETLGDNNRGVSIFTIDDLYNSCLDKYLIVNSEENTIYFEVDSEGMMNTCGYVPNGCMDDCFFGFRISEFNWTE